MSSTKRHIESSSYPLITGETYIRHTCLLYTSELCEWAAAAITGRDLQHVLGTGVNDTMQDMLVCLIGTLLFCPLIPRFYRGGYDPLTGAVAGFLGKNGLCAADN